MPKIWLQVSALEVPRAMAKCKMRGKGALEMVDMARLVLEERKPMLVEPKGHEVINDQREDKETSRS